MELSKDFFIIDKIINGFNVKNLSKKIIINKSISKVNISNNDFCSVYCDVN